MDAMGWLLLILVLLAAAFGVLGAVLKAAVFLILTITLTVVALAAVAYYYGRHRLRQFQRRMDDDLATRSSRSSSTVEIGDKASPPPDDRY